jgi:hypothetical protein
LSPPPAPPRQPVVVETTVSTRYYSVRGTTTPTIFAAIDANGLVETSGQFQLTARARRFFCFFLRPLPGGDRRRPVVQCLCRPMSVGRE